MASNVEGHKRRPCNAIKIEFLPGLINSVYGHPATRFWKGQYLFDDTYKIFTLQPNSQEYAAVEKRFSEYSPSLWIRCIKRVENPYLMGQYLLKKEGNPNFQEMKLFHGTQRQYVRSICKNNFDWRKTGQSRGHKFGQGVSFAYYASYAAHYTKGDKIMFLAKVLVNETFIGDSTTVVPPHMYDTSINHDETVYVKYEDDDFYPEYIIHFSDYY